MKNIGLNTTTQLFKYIGANFRKKKKTVCKTTLNMTKLKVILEKRKK